MFKPLALKKRTPSVTAVLIYLFVFTLSNNKFRQKCILAVEPGGCAFDNFHTRGDWFDSQSELLFKHITLMKYGDCVLRTKALSGVSPR